MSPSSSTRRLPRRIGVALAVGMLVVPSVPAIGAVIDPDVPMVASARSGAERTRVDPASASPAVDPVVTEVVRLTNIERAAAGRPALVLDPAVQAAAAAHSADQAATGRMSHTGSDGSSAGARLTRAGYAWRTWGENVAYGQRSPQEVVDAWMGSSGHRANILNAAFTTIGVGAVTGADGRLYWTMVLAAG